MSLFSNWRVVASTIILLTVIASFFPLSFFGAVAATLAGCATICLIWCQLLYSAVLAVATIAVGLAGAFWDNPTTRKAMDVATLTIEFHTDPVTNNLDLDDQDLAFDVIFACGVHNYQQAMNVARDAMSAIHEPVWSSWISWAFKPSNEPGRCFTEAARLAARSPAYKQKLEAILR